MSQTPETPHPSDPLSQPQAKPAKPESVNLSAEMEAEIDAAMLGATASGAAPARDRAAPERPRRTQHEAPKRAEIEAAHAAAAPKPIRGPRVVQGGREHRKGIVVSVGPTDIFLEFGPKELGVLPRVQFPDEAELPKVGAEYEAVVERFDAAESLFICNRPGVVQKAEWELLEPGQIVEARVTGVNKGGLELEIANHRAFMPASQVDTRRVDDLSVFVGEKVRCKVTKVDRSGRGNITLSRRDVVGAERKEEMKRLKESLKEGDVREGVVRKIMPFGAFVDIGGVDGLVHVSDISHDRNVKVEAHLKEGDKVQVKILKLDWENDRHSLGVKQLQADPFETAIKDVVEGAELSGRVTKLMEFGAFVEVAPGIEGLVHISELAWQRVMKTSDVVQPDKVVKVKVLKVDPETRKISLSIKQTLEAPAPRAAGPGGPGGRGGRGKRGDEDMRKPEEILAETPALRRLREQSKAKHKTGLKSGLGVGNLGIGLGDLKL
jgi:small subunit ribosomal protein S1